MKNVAIYGAGGFGREIRAALSNACLGDFEHKFIGFFDDQDLSHSLGDKYLGGIERLNSWPEPLAVVVAMGWSDVREQAVARISNPRLYFPSLIARDAILSDRPRVRIGKGCIVLAGSNLTTDICLGDFVVININATIGHDADLDDFSSVMPSVNISGSVKLGRTAFVGSGATVLNGLAIGSRAIVGAGSVVTRSVGDNEMVAGNPARPLNHKKS